MDGGGRRQLPSWMMRTAATGQASILEIKGGNEETSSVEPQAKPVKPQKKAQAKNHDTGVPMVDDNPRLLENCEARKRKRKLCNHEKSQGERSKGGESCSLKPCKGSRSKRLLAKHGEDQIGEFLESGVEDNVDGLVKNRVRDNVPKKKQLKNFQEISYGTVESSSSEDELSVEDLVSIAKEYLEANRMEVQKSQNMEFELDTKHQADSEIGLEKQLTAHRESSSVTDQSLSLDSSLTKPVSTEGNNINLSTDFDPCRDMLDILLGHWLKKPEELK